IPKGALKVSEDHRTVTLEMKDVEVADQPLWPDFHAAMRPAKLSFRLVLAATEEKVTWYVAERQFLFDGPRAKAQLEASVEGLERKYSWKHEALENSAGDFAILGKEANGNICSRWNGKIDRPGKGRRRVILNSNKVAAMQMRAKVGAVAMDL